MWRTRRALATAWDRMVDFNLGQRELWERYLTHQVRPWEPNWMHWIERDGEWVLAGRVAPPQPTSLGDTVWRLRRRIRPAR